jgi:hypothetical protein
MNMGACLMFHGTPKIHLRNYVMTCHHKRYRHTSEGKDLVVGLPWVFESTGYIDD